MKIFFFLPFNFLYLRFLDQQVSIPFFWSSSLSNTVALGWLNLFPLFWFPLFINFNLCHKFLNAYIYIYFFFNKCQSSVPSWQTFSSISLCHPTLMAKCYYLRSINIGCLNYTQKKYTINSDQHRNICKISIESDNFSATIVKHADQDTELKPF